MMQDRIKTPLDLLFPFQRKIVENPSRFKLLNCARQCGKSTIFAFEAAMSCAARPGDLWIALSGGQRQADAWIMRAGSMSKVWASYVEARFGVALSCDCKKSEILFSNGSRIISLPALPRTIRGYSANVILDEFAHHEKPEETWAAVFPSITNEVGGRRFRLYIGSTPATRQNLFWKLFVTPTWKSGFARWKITIENAVESGVPIDLPSLRSAISDDDVWEQEYMCIPSDSSASLLPMSLLHEAEDSSARTDCNDSEFDTLPANLYVGVDIGRKRDLTVICVVKREADTFTVKAVRTLRNAPFRDQFAAISRVLAHKGIRACQIDATGIGAQLGEDLSRQYRHTVAVNITATIKSDMYLSLRRNFDSHQVRIPRADTRDAESFLEDLSAVQKSVTRTGRISFFAPSREDGHSDRACALALALRAAEGDWAVSGKVPISAPRYKDSNVDVLPNSFRWL